MTELLLAPPRLIPMAVHEVLLQELRRYCMIGGMPGCVQTWLDTQSILDVRTEQDNLLSAFQQDFSKYTPKVDRHCLETVWENAAKAVGTQIAYARLAPDYTGTTNKKAFEVLSMAHLLRPVRASSAAAASLHEAKPLSKYVR